MAEKLGVGGFQIDAHENGLESSEISLDCAPHGLSIDTMVFFDNKKCIKSPDWTGGSNSG
jgi:hypothetical protein